MGNSFQLLTYKFYSATINSQYLIFSNNSQNVTISLLFTLKGIVMNEPTVQSSSDPSQMWNVLCHVSALLGLVFPLGFIVGPLVIWLIKRKEFPSVDINGKEALNFQLSCLIYMAISALLMLVIVGFFLLAAVVIFDVVMIIVASVQVSDGKSFRYPLTIRLIN